MSPPEPWRDNAAMAQRTKIQLIDDVDGTAATQTVRFALDGRELEIDLSDRNAAKLRKALDPYVGAGRRLGSQSGTSDPDPALRDVAPRPVIGARVDPLIG